MGPGVDRKDKAGLFRTIRVLGFPIAATSYREAYLTFREWADAGERPWLVEAANTHVVAMARHRPDFGATMEAFDCCLPDGMPLVWTLNRRLGPSSRLTDRVYGPTLMLKAFEWSGQDGGASHFLLGGSSETLEKLVSRMRGRYPNAKIAGRHSPPFGSWGDDEDARICEMIRDSGADFVWVGLGCPKQEHWLSRMRGALPPAVYFGIGAAFAFHAGDVRQAPRWMQRLGLEWFFRLVCEPRRLFRRYFVYNSLFIFYSLKEMADVRFRRADDGEAPRGGGKLSQ